MAEFLFKDMVDKRGLADKFYIASAATSSYEIGNPVHPGTRNKLAQYGISVGGKTAVQLTKADYNKYDYLIGMESSNIRNILRIVGSDSRHKEYINFYSLQAVSAILPTHGIPAILMLLITISTKAALLCWNICLKIKPAFKRNLVESDLIQRGKTLNTGSENHYNRNAN